jgi:hypothetical protein
MHSEIFEAVIAGACVIVWLTVMAPIVVYLLTSWIWRREDIVTTMSVKALDLYYAQFFPSLTLPSDPVAFFRKDFNRRYGRRLYLPPLILLGAASTAGMAAIGGTLLAMAGIAGSNSFRLDPIALAALGGGFTWVVSDQLGRFRTRDFTTYDTYNGVFRLLLSIPLGYSLGAVAGQGPWSGSVAYLLGTFPTSTLLKIGRRFASQKLNMSDDASPAGSELEQLPDVGKAFAERLNDEGVNSISELAYADPVNLTIRTNKPFTYITDCISQALLWMYVTTSLPKLSILGLRGAQEVSNLLDGLKANDDDAVQTLASASAVLGVSPQALRNTFGEVGGDPYTKFLVEIWSIEAPVAVAAVVGKTI